MPTGVALRDARECLLDAAERVLFRDGVSALTSRAVTTEAGCAKGVLHRHFETLDALLAELIQDRIAKIDGQTAALHDAAGSGTVVDNLADALTDLFESGAVTLANLFIVRDELRARLRKNRPTGIPVLTDAAAMIAPYLIAERDLGRIEATDAELNTLAPALIGAAHLLYADQDDATPQHEEIRQVVATIVGGVLR